MEAGNHSLQEAISCGGMVSRKIQQLFRERHIRRPLPDLEKTLARQLRHRRGAVGLPIRVFTIVARKQPRKEVKNPECIRIRDFWWTLTPQIRTPSHWKGLCGKSYFGKRSSCMLS